MKLLGICGSPRQGATAYAVKEGLNYAEKKPSVKSDYFSVRNKNIKFCLHCDYCVREKKGCIHDDDMTQAYGKMKKADAIIIGTPVYNGSISGQLKTFLDRCRALVAGNPDVFKNKVGAGIAVGGDRIGGQELALLTIHSFYLANKITPVSGGPFGANLGGTIWSRDLGKRGTQEDVEGVRTIHRTIDRLIQLSLLLKKGKGSV